MVRKLDAGYVPRPAQERALLASAPGAIRERPARAKAFQAVYDNTLSRDDALKFYPELRHAFNTLAVAKLRHAKEPARLQAVREALQAQLNAGRIPALARTAPQLEMQR